MDEQTLFGLMAIAQEQQKAIDTALHKLSARQIELNALITRAGGAFEKIEQSSQNAASIIEKATQSAVEQGIKQALQRVTEQTRTTLADAINPATHALNEVTTLVIETDKQLHATKNSLSWKLFGVMALVCCLLLASTVGLAKMFVPSLQEITELRATASELERRGGKIQLSTCGDDRRLCAKVSLKAKSAGDVYGKNSEWMILQGY